MDGLIDHTDAARIGLGVRSRALGIAPLEADVLTALSAGRPFTATELRASARRQRAGVAAERRDLLAAWDHLAADIERGRRPRATGTGGLDAERQRFKAIAFAFSEGNHFGRPVLQSTVRAEVVTAAERAVRLAIAELRIAPFALRWFDHVSPGEYLAAPEASRSEFIVSKCALAGAVRAEWVAWIATNQSPADAAGTVLHEARHLWQRTSDLPEADSEPDAYAYEARWQDVIAGWTYDEARAS